MSKRNYTHIKEVLPAIQTMVAEGKTQREIAEYFGFKDKEVVREALKRERRKKRQIPKTSGRKPAMTLEEYKYEKEHADVPLKEGPFANLLKKLSQIQECLPTSIELSPLRLAIVTSRSLPSHFRVIKTLRKWGVYVDEAYFLGGLKKDELLKAFGAHIFFDDQDTHLSSSSKYVPSGKVPYYSDSQINKVIKERESKKAAE